MDGHRAPGNRFAHRIPLTGRLAIAPIAESLSDADRPTLGEEGQAVRVEW